MPRAQAPPPSARRAPAPALRAQLLLPILGKQPTHRPKQILGELAVRLAPHAAAAKSTLCGYSVGSTCIDTNGTYSVTVVCACPFIFSPLSNERHRR